MTALLQKPVSEGLRLGLIRRQRRGAIDEKVKLRRVNVLHERATGVVDRMRQRLPANNETIGNLQLPNELNMTKKKRVRRS